MKPLYLFSIINLISLASFAQGHELVRNVDKLSGKVVVTTVTSPHKHSPEPIQYKRTSENGQVRYFILLYAEGSSSLHQKGATVVFKDGAKIEWTDAVVEANVQGNQYTSYCLINLTDDIIEQFQEKEIAFIKINTHEQVLDSDQSQRAKTLLNRMLFSDLPDFKSDRIVSQE